MSKPRGVLESAVRVVFLILMGFIAFVFSSSLFMLFFVPIIGWYVWSTNDRAADLEKRLAVLERPAEPKSEKP